MKSIALVAVVLVLGGEHGATPVALARAESLHALQVSGPAQAVPLPALQGVPAAPAPDALAVTQLPDTLSAVTAFIKRLPPEVAGHTRTPQFDHFSPERIVVGYGEAPPIGAGGVVNPLLRILAFEIARGGFFPPNWTGGQVVGFMASQLKSVKEAGRDGDLFWVRDETPAGIGGSNEPVSYGIVWGRVDSAWMFSVQADTREHSDALLTAFVTAARSASRE